MVHGRTSEGGAGGRRRGRERGAVPAPVVDTDVKRVVRAAAALRGLYDDTAIGRVVGRTGVTVSRWWQGQLPDARTLLQLAQAIGLDYEELAKFWIGSGPPPTLRPRRIAESDPRLRELEEFEGE